MGYEKLKKERFEQEAGRDRRRIVKLIARIQALGWELDAQRSLNHRRNLATTRLMDKILTNEQREAWVKCHTREIPEGPLEEHMLGALAVEPAGLSAYDAQHGWEEYRKAALRRSQGASGTRTWWTPADGEMALAGGREDDDDG